MTTRLFTAPLRPPTIQELEEAQEASVIAGYFTPLEIAKQEIHKAEAEVRDAQYSTGKGIWEDSKDGNRH